MAQENATANGLQQALSTMWGTLKIYGSDVWELLRLDLSPKAISAVKDGRRDGHPYRGAVHYLINVVEKALAVGFLIYLGFQAYHVAGLVGDSAMLEEKLGEITVTLAVLLLLDAGLRIAELIGEPGVEETLGALLVALAGTSLLAIKEATVQRGLRLQDAAGIAVLIGTVSVLAALLVILPRLRK